MLGKCSVTELNLWPAVSLLTLWILGSKCLYLMSNQSYWLTAKQVCVVCVREREREKERGGEGERGGKREGKREEKKRERKRNFTSQSVLLRTLPGKQLGLQAGL